MKANARGWDHTARYTELSQERSHLSGLAPNASTPLPAALDVEVDACFVVKERQKPVAIQFSVTPVTFAMKITR
jgi:hypothetical protein